jgi:tRNA threonylcarbamoyladenosine biosynthesis protein TsaE
MNLSQNDLPIEITCTSAEETIALGESLVPLLKKGSIVAISGPLGSGKTYFTKGIARGLEIKSEVTSPSYTIISEYEAFPYETNLKETEKPVKFHHIDLYRLSGINDFSNIGGEEIIFGGGISVIEWAERIIALLPKETIRVDIRILGDEKRLIKIDKNNNFPYTEELNEYFSL